MSTATDARDPGLQPERTALAWSRTGLAVLVNALLVLRAGLQLGSRPTAGLGVALLSAALVVIVYGARRQRQLLRGGVPAAPAARVFAAVGLLALVTCLAAVPVIVRMA